jgi:protocatechuate 3,4-dioxygenase beta subunit
MRAQGAPSTTLSGTVADASGGLVPNAGLELTNTQTHWSRKTTTDPQGRFLFSLVPPGGYQLQVSADGFSPVRQDGLQLDADVPATLHVALSVATSVTAITIKEDAPMVDAQSGTVRQVVGEQYIEDLPLQGAQCRHSGLHGSRHRPRQRHR